MTRADVILGVNLIAAALFGAIGGSAITAHVLTTRVEAANAAATASHAAQIKELKDEWDEMRARYVQTIDLLVADKKNCEAGAASLTGQARMHAMMDSWYTLVYEPDAAAGGSPLQMLDLVKPGLGTLLARLQSAPQPAGMQLRYVLHGIVQPASAPQGAKFVRTQTAPTEQTQ
jgi:hypothetical protein